MDKATVLEKLRAHQAELQAAGIAHLRLFGSVARGQQTAESDVDLLADLHPEKKLSLLSIVGLENKLADLLEDKVHLSLADSMRAKMKEEVEREAVLAF